MSELPEFGVDWGDLPSNVTSERRPDSQGVKRGDKGRKISSYRRNCHCKGGSLSAVFKEQPGGQ